MNDGKGKVILNKTLQRAIEEQRHYFERGMTRSLAFRRQMLQMLKHAVQQHEESLLQALQNDLGKSRTEAYMTELGPFYVSIDYANQHVERWMQRQKVSTPIYFQKAESWTQRDPYGVVCIVGPFNYPVQLVLEPLIGAIAGGNCAIIKPSEYAKETADVLERIITTIFPLQYVRIMQGEAEWTNELFHAPFDKIFFTGSVRVGKIAMKAAAERLTPLTLELGGKSPVIVDETAKLKKAAERIAWGKWTNAGQTCVAPDYAFVHSSVLSSFLSLLKSVVQRFYGEDPSKSEDYGRIIHEHHWDRLDDLLQQTESSIVFGGERDRAQRYIAPTIVVLDDTNNPLMEDELFGPILPILPYDDIREVVDYVDRHSRPLAAYVFTERQDIANYVMTMMRFGGGCINDTLTHVGNLHLPFGGVGTSGVGTYHGKATFDAFTHEKAIMQKSTKVYSNFAYPPYAGKETLLRTFLK